MFHNARLKLTTWYVIIIMFISMLFSMVIYTGINSELMRIEHFQQIRLERERQGIFPLPLPRPVSSVDIEMLEESRGRLTLILILVDLGILIISGGAAYFLSGRTLKPIKLMVEEQNRFITDASHELRTPLTSLRSEIEVSLRDKKISMTDAKELLKSNLEEVVNLQTLSDNLMELSQYQMKNGSTPFTKLSLAQITQSALKKIMPLARAKNIRIENKTKDLSLEGSQPSLIELLVILLDNAVKYSENNSTILLVSHKDDSVIDIKVTDKGIGIKNDELLHVFDRFYRADKSRSKVNVKGYGLGLSIAKKIVDIHHGEILVESKIGKGTTFTIKLPIKQ